MSPIEAILLGIIQGATEFLPISSSGHLVLLPVIFGLPEPDLQTVATAHLGTLVAVLVYFRRDLSSVATAVWSGLRLRQYFATPEARLGWYIAVGTIPSVAAGLLLGDFLDSAFGRPVFAAAMLLGTAFALVVAERLLTGRKSLDRMGWADSIIIGLAQVFALLPGISRSGVTISAGIGRGLERASAARFSFLLGIPAIAGAGLLSLYDLTRANGLAGRAPDLGLTFLTAAIVGFLCIHFLLAWLRGRTLYPFALYCAVLGSAFLIISAL